MRVLTHAHVQRVLFDGSRAVRVEYTRRGRIVRAEAAGAVILCAGAFASPQILLLSGVGPAAYLRQSAMSAYHPAGTCKMGHDPMAVVDDRLRVRGLANLHVADASIMPAIVSGNLHATCVMIGEKAADLIRASG